MELRQVSVASPRYEEVHIQDLIINVILISGRRRVLSREYHNNEM